MYYSDPDEHFDYKYMEIMGLYSTILTQVELDPSYENSKEKDRIEIGAYYTAMSHTYLDDEILLVVIRKEIEDIESSDDVTQDEDEFISVLIDRIEAADQEHTRALKIRAKKKDKKNADKSSRNKRS